MNVDPGHWSWALTTVQITGSAVSGPLNAVTVGGDATVEGGTAQNEDAFGAPGIVFRPRPPSDEKGSDEQVYRVGAEAIAASMGDRLTPFTWRDLRLNKVFPSPKPGTIALVGYGGAFLAFDDVADPTNQNKKLSLATLYVPYDIDSTTGVAKKCHAIILDPAQEAIGIVHGDGVAIAMDKENGIVMRADGSTSLVLKPGTFQVAAENISLNGNTACGGVAAFPVVNAPALVTALGAIAVTLGGDPTSAVPATVGMLVASIATLITALTPGTGPAATKNFAAL